MSIEALFWTVAVLALLGVAYLKIVGEPCFDPCPRCKEADKTSQVDIIENFVWRTGAVRDPKYFHKDSEGNLWLSSYNRQCRTCGHKWYVPVGIPEWDELRTKPILHSVPGEGRRFREEKAKRGGGVPMEVFCQIMLEERAKAGFVKRNGVWVKDTKSNIQHH